MKKNEIYEIEITGLTDSAQGVGRVDDFVVFVQGALPGERLLAKIVKVNKTYAFGRVEQLLQKSQGRIEPDCPCAKTCGGCQLRHISYAGELVYKQRKVEDALTRIGGITLSPLPILGADETTHYRNKGQFPVGKNAEGNPVCGLYASRSHRIVETYDCLLQHPDTQPILCTVLAVMKAFSIPAYDEASHTGCIRHIYIRVSHATGEIMVILVTAAKTLPHAKELTDALLATGLPIVSVIQNINPERTNVVLGKKHKLLYGKDAITDTILDASYQISHQSFYQVNPRQTEKLYQTVLDFAQLSGNETVLDLYCGIGTITLLLSRHAKRAFGVEIVPQAIENAKENAKLNGIHQAEFLCGDSGIAFNALSQKGIKPDLIVVDPPRNGLERGLIEAIGAWQVPKLIYVSCNPGTLARDLKLLQDFAYRPEIIQPVDMFPRTHHVEVVVSMSNMTNK